jgi:pyrimidine-specific ribonucleoside hydrolase
VLDLRAAAADTGGARVLENVQRAAVVDVQSAGGRTFHDPLAIDELIGEWAEVEIYRERGEWGSRLSPGSGTRIIVGYNHERFVQMLLA